MRAQSLSFSRHLLLLVLLGSTTNASAERLGFSLVDQAGDPRDNFDLTQIDFEFDNASGDFWVTATATVEHPFDGSHLLYLSLFNPDAPTEYSYFSIVRFGFFAEQPTTVLSRSGTNSVLTGWNDGDHVASYDLFGSPSGNPFYSVLGGNTAVYSQSDELLDDAVITAVVPEPSSLVLGVVLAFCLLGARGFGR